MRQTDRSGTSMYNATMVSALILPADKIARLEELSRKRPAVFQAPKAAPPRASKFHAGSCEQKTERVPMDATERPEQQSTHPGPLRTTRLPTHECPTRFFLPAKTA